MSPFRPDLVDVWIFRLKDRPEPAAGRKPAPGDLPASAGRKGGAGATAPGASAGPLPDQVEILLMKRSPGRILPGLWQCVSGSLEPGESIPAGALRELLEETGFGPESIEAFFDLDQVNQFHEPSVGAIVSSAVFAVRVASPAEPVLSHEHDDMRWVSPQRALELAVWPAYRESIKRIVENFLDPGRSIWFELTLDGVRVRR